VRQKQSASARSCEGNAPIVECLSGDANTCRIAPVCKLAGMLIDGFDALYEHLNRYTLADLMIGRKALATVLIQQ
jgi:Rrf2 family nitric oxide-sensitive transcriptional repressor